MHTGADLYGPGVHFKQGFGVAAGMSRAADG